MEERIVKCLDHYRPRHRDMIEAAETKEALLAIPVEYRILLVMRAKGYTERESLQMAGLSDRREFQHARDAFNLALDHDYLLLKELGIIAA